MRHRKCSVCEKWVTTWMMRGGRTGKPVCPKCWVGDDVIENLPKKVNVLGIELDEWRYKSCLAHVATDKSWATIYDIQSQQEGQGHATKLLLIMKEYYERQSKEFGGSVGLNERMSRLYKKCEIREYV